METCAPVRLAQHFDLNKEVIMTCPGESSSALPQQPGTGNAPLINKNLALSLVQKAKAAHLKWRVYAQGLVEGLDCPQDSVPILSTECEFGKWYYHQGKQMLGELTFYQALEPPHEILHALYGQIYHLVAQGKFEEARKHMPGLIEISETLLKTIAFLEEEIASLPPHTLR